MSASSDKPLRVEYVVNSKHLDDYFERLVRRVQPANREIARYLSSFVITTSIVACGMFFLMRESSVTTRVASISEVVFAGLVLLPIMDHRARRAKMRKILARSTGGGREYPYAVEIRRQGLWIDSDGTQSLFPWKSLTEIIDTDDYFEFELDSLGLAIVAKDAFENEADAAEFIRVAREWRSAGLIGTT